MKFAGDFRPPSVNITIVYVVDVLLMLITVDVISNFMY